MEFAALLAIFVIIAFLQLVGAQHGGMGGMGGGSSGSIDGGWASWSTCTVTCGGGVQSRSRTCTKPPPGHGGEGCQGDDSMTRSCNKNPCPVDGVWSPWTRWSSCSRTCATGVRSRFRTCSNPPPKNGGKNCEGYPQWPQYCNQAPCPGKRQSVNTRRGAIGGSIGAVVFCVIVVIVYWKKRTQRGHT